jgi:phosphoglycerate dehydrogenase-like enzyme
MTTAPRVAVLSRSFCRHPVLRAEVASRYPDVRFNDSDTTLSGPALVEFLTGCDRAIVALEKITGELLDAVPPLRVLAKYGVGCDNIDLRACAARGVRVGWTGGVNRRSVAELALSFMISLLRQVGPATALVREGGWRQIVGRQLSDRVVGLIGLGHVGQEVVRLLAPFGCRVLATDIRDVSAFAFAHGVELVPLSTLLATADVVSLHVPLTAATRMMIDRAALGTMRPDAILLNTARGGLIDEGALLDALKGGQLAGAAIDVFATEPPVDVELARQPNVIATPHIGGSAAEAILAMGRAAIAGLENASDPLELVPEYLRGG